MSSLSEFLSGLTYDDVWQTAADVRYFADTIPSHRIELYILSHTFSLIFEAERDHIDALVINRSINFIERQTWSTDIHVVIKNMALENCQKALSKIELHAEH